MLLTAIPKDNEVAAMSDVGERVKKIVVKHLGVEAEKVTENTSFIEGLGADSLDTIELVMAFEDEFGCEIPDDAAETILTVGDAIKFLEKKTQKANARRLGQPLTSQRVAFYELVTASLKAAG